MVYKAPNPDIAGQPTLQTPLLPSVRPLLVARFAWAVVAVLMLAPSAALAQAKPAAPPPTPAPGTPPAKVEAAPQAVPGFWDPRRRPERPDLSRIQSIRFLTDLDYPPFDYAGPDGNPTGFNVDLARLICDEIKVACTIQAPALA